MAAPCVSVRPLRRRHVSSKCLLRVAYSRHLPGRHERTPNPEFQNFLRVFFVKLFQYIKTTLILPAWYDFVVLMHIISIGQLVLATIYHRHIGVDGTHVHDPTKDLKGINQTLSFVDESVLLIATEWQLVCTIALTVAILFLLIHAHRPITFRFARPSGTNEFAAVSSSQGYREHMEDKACLIPPNDDHKDRGFYAVFDGHKGVKAARYAAENLHSLVLSNPSSADGLAHAITTLDKQWLASSPADDDGTTVIAALVDNGRLLIANVGDSRAVLCTRRGLAVPLSIDHKLTVASEVAQVNARGGTVKWNSGCLRVNGELNMSRSVGDRTLKQWITSDADVQMRAIAEEDEFCILASDGLWDVVSNQQACDCVRAKRTPQQASKALVDLALAYGSRDNVTCLVINLAPFHRLSL